MKKLALAVALTASFSANASITTATEYRYDGDTDYSTFCKAVVENDLDLMKRTISSKVGDLASNRKDVVRKLVSENGMTCNGADLIEFSKQREASEVHAYLLSHSN